MNDVIMPVLGEALPILAFILLVVGATVLWGKVLDCIERSEWERKWK